jgi:Mg2+ and Co2+ transporter CorA
MNVKVPGEAQIEAFWIIVGSMGVMLVGMLAYFRHRDFL